MHLAELRRVLMHFGLPIEELAYGLLESRSSQERSRLDWIMVLDRRIEGVDSGLATELRIKEHRQGSDSLFELDLENGRYYWPQNRFRNRQTLRENVKTQRRDSSNGKKFQAKGRRGMVD